MKYVKMLGLAAVAVMAAMAFLGTSPSSADVLCTVNQDPCPKKEVVTKIWEISIQKNWASSRIEDTSGSTTLSTCTGGLAGTSEVKQGEGVHVTGEITELTWSGCTTTTDTVKNGSIEVSRISGTSKGTVTLKSTEMTLTITGVSCTYGAGTGADIGTLSSTTEPEEATIAVNAVLTKTAGGFLCPADVRWVDVPVITSHKTIYLDTAA
jgi:hypothetical protein